MFNLGFSELLLLGLIALVVIGPKQLPEMARTLARFLNELKRATSDLTEPLQSMKSDLQDELKKNLQIRSDGIKREMEEINSQMSQLHSQVQQGVTSATRPGRDSSQDSNEGTPSSPQHTMPPVTKTPASTQDSSPSPEKTKV